MSVTKRPRAVFMGSPDFAVPCLQVAAARCHVVAVYTQPDRPAGRQRRPTPPAVKVAAERLGLAVRQPASLRDPAVIAELVADRLELAIVVAYGRILPPAALAAPARGCVNVHASLLPRWRGAAPIQRAILAGDRETGVCIMQMDAGLDTGPIHRAERTPIGPDETAGALFERLAALGAQALDRFLAEFPPTEPPAPQPAEGATLAPKLRKDEGVIDWARPAQAIVDHVRGMDPWPCAQTWLEARAGDPLRVFGARLASEATDGSGSAPPPGTIVGLHGEQLVVACGQGAVALAAIQPPGKPRLAAAAWWAGRRVRGLARFVG